MLTIEYVYGTSNIRCAECGGTCDITIRNYDDVMHKEDCNRLKELKIWEKYPKVQKVSMQTHYFNVQHCALGIHAARSCPALYKLLAVIPNLALPPSTICRPELVKDCYQALCEPLEEQVLALVEEL